MYLSALAGGNQTHQQTTAVLRDSGSASVAIGWTYCFVGAEAFDNKHGKEPLTWWFKAARIAIYPSILAGV